MHGKHVLSLWLCREKDEALFMTDHGITVPDSFAFVNQYASNKFAKKPSKSRCVTASVAMTMEIVAPNRWNPEQLEDELYVQWAGPDVASDTQGIDISKVLPWFQQQGIPFVDLTPLLSTDDTQLRHTMERMNLMGIPQILTVEDESKLCDIAGHKLHNWADQGEGHAFVRVGFSDSDGGGLYYEPAAPGFEQPVRISWANSIVPAKLHNVFAVIPVAFGQPPVDFDWLTQEWPRKVEQPDLATVHTALQTALASMDAVNQHTLTTQTALAQVMAEMAKAGIV